MNSKTKTIYFLLLLICWTLPFQTVLSQNKKPSFIFKGEYIIDNKKKLDQTLIGGLSGIDYISDDNFYFISDDKGEHGPPRFYKAKIDYSKKGITSVDFIAVKKLTPSPGKTFATTSDQTDTNKFIRSDAESIRYDKSSGELFWSSEGHDTKEFLSQPFIFSMDTNGLFHKQIATDPIYRFDTSEKKGSQRNSAFEAISLIPGTGDMIYCSEKSLLQDINSLSDKTKPIRITVADKKSGAASAQYVYMVDDVFENNSNGISEMIAVSADTFLVLERAFILWTSVRLYRATVDPTTSDVRTYPDLKNKAYTPLKKELLLDFTTLGLKYVDNIEGMTWGYPLNGNRTMLFISDNNFNPLQITQLLLFEYVGK